MRKITKISNLAAVVTLAAATVLSGCSGSKPAETTAAETTTAAAAESTETTTAALSKDEAAILALNPQRPADMGKIKLGDFSTIEVTAPNPQEIREEDIDTYISEYILPTQTRTVEDAVQDGDTVNIDFKGKLNGEAFEGGTAEGYDLAIGSHSFIDGFEDGLIGLKPGDDIALNLTFPKEYHKEDLAGQDVVFEVKVNSITRPMQLADMTDELCEELSSGNYKTVQEYRDGVREALVLSANAIAKGELYNNVLAEAIKLCEVELKEEVVDWEMDLYLQNYDKTLQSSYGFGLAGLLEMYQTDFDSFKSDIRDGAAISAAQSAIVDAIAKAEGFELNDETFKRYLESYGYEEELVKGSTTEAWLEETVLQFLAGEHLANQAKVNYISYEDYQAEQMALAEAEAAAAEAEAAEAK